MNEFETIIDFGSKNLRLGIFDNLSNCVYSSKIKITENQENFLSKLIRDAEKHLSTHLQEVNVLYDSSKFNFIDFSIKKSFDQPTLLKKIFSILLEEANFLISENNFKDQVIHIIVNKIIADNNKLEKISDDIKIKSLIVELKFICINKSLLNNLSNIFKKDNLIISNIYCSSYVKTYSLKNNLKDINNFIFVDIGFERTTALIYYNNKFEFLKSIPFGGNSITKDISKILKLNIDYSEELKIKLNNNSNELILTQNLIDSNNLYSDIFKKNISLKMLRNIIEARLEEIIEMVVIKNNYFKKIYSSEKPCIVFIGDGSILLSDNYKLNIKKRFSDVIYMKESDSKICEAGFNYIKSKESLLTEAKKKIKKSGFFESFFNLFSK